MTFDPIVILSTINILLSLSGVYLFVRLCETERTIKMIMRETVSAEEALRAADRLIASDVRHLSAEVTAHARALDNHTDRLLSLEETGQ